MNHISINKNYRKMAQSILEYTVVIACVAAALIAMQTYVKRSIQGKVRDAADEIGEQYSARHTTSSVTQVISNSKPVKITGTTKFMEDPETKEKYEMMEVTRTENITMSIQDGSYEGTGALYDSTGKPIEKLFE